MKTYYTVVNDTKERITPTPNIIVGKAIKPSIEIISIDNSIATYILYYNSRDNVSVIETEVIVKPLIEFSYVEINLLCPTSWGLIILYGFDKIPAFSNYKIELFTIDECEYLKKTRPEIFTVN